MINFKTMLANGLYQSLNLFLYVMSYADIYPLHLRITRII